MRGKLITKWSIIIIILLVAVYDIAALVIWGVGATISNVIGIEESFASPLIPFGVGFVVGHVFWPQYREK